jgi:hypothetical protein
LYTSGLVTGVKYLLVLVQSNKPIMEKRRRARINHCLNELKALILDAMKKDVSYSPAASYVYCVHIYFEPCLVFHIFPTFLRFLQVPRYQTLP